MSRAFLRQVGNQVGNETSPAGSLTSIPSLSGRSIPVVLHGIRPQDDPAPGPRPPPDRRRADPSAIARLNFRLWAFATRRHVSAMTMVKNLAAA
jgi:hypothetical protein